MSVIAAGFWRSSETALLTLRQRRYSLCLRPYPHGPPGSQASQASSVSAPMTEISALAVGHRPCPSTVAACACMTRGRTPLHPRGVAASAARGRGPASSLQRRAERWLKILYRILLHVSSDSRSYPERYSTTRHSKAGALAWMAPWPFAPTIPQPPPPCASVRSDRHAPSGGFTPAAIIPTFRTALSHASHVWCWSGGAVKSPPHHPSEEM